MEAHGRTAEHVAGEAAGDGLHDILWTPIGTATVDAARLRMGAHVLNACCGSGATALAAAERTSPVGTVDAVGPSAPLITRARGEAAARRLSNVHFVQGDVLKCPPRRGGYDSVLCSGGTNAFSDPASTTEWLLQLLRPGGRLTVSVWAEASLEPLAETLLQALALAEAVPESTLWSGAEHNPTGTHALLREWLTARSLSFPDIRTHRLTLPADPKLLWPLVLGTPLKGLLDGLTPAATACVRRRFAQVLLAGRRETLDVATLIGTGTLCRVMPAVRAGDARPWRDKTHPVRDAGPPTPP
ncbi:Methyltransferase domain-containing protein [Streptomyces sp. WMMB 714]|nr:class I SAM-dependent methyltransferase [Streptomyces sp. WMMB 714]SCK09664.1 Methyltransferase domain-containing protein [Streptomyces sp. WMMB 714]